MKAQALPEGAKRTWSGINYVKQNGKWIKVAKGHGPIKLSPEQVTTHAENTSGDSLKKVIGDESKHPHLRDAAKRELERRKADQEKSKPKPEPKKPEPVEDIRGLKDFTLGYAPFREGKISDLSEGAKAFQEKSFREWKDMASQFAKAIGIKISQDNNSIGIYGSTSANAEASALPMVKGTPEQVELFAALMGSLAPDKQHSVMTLEHDPNGTTSAHHIAFKDSKGAQDFIKNREKYGISDVSLIPESNTAVVLDFGGGDFKKHKVLEDYGQQIKGVEERNVNARFIGEDEYGGIVQKARNSSSKHNEKISGTDYADVLRLADKRGSWAQEVKSKPKKKADVVKYTPADNLSPEHSAIEKRLGKQLNKNYDKAVSQYEKNFGNVLNTDNARELSKDYNKNRAELSVAVHEPASAFVKKMYADKLAEPTPKGKRNLVYFTAGGTGAGKTSGLQGKEKNFYDKAHMVFDTNMNTFPSAQKKMDQALEAGKKIRLNYTFRDPVDAFENGAVPRSLRIGRTVPIEEHIKTHLGSMDTILALKNHYKDNKNVKIVVTDNSGGKGNAKQVPHSFVKDQEKKYIASELREKLHSINDKLYESGKITASHHKGFRG